jgi:hypothetical protein
LEFLMLVEYEQIHHQQLNTLLSLAVVAVVVLGQAQVLEVLVVVAQVVCVRLQVSRLLKVLLRLSQ